MKTARPNQPHPPEGNRPWFIHDQRWLVLTAAYRRQDEVKHYCQPKFYRLTADGVSSDEMIAYSKAFTPPPSLDDVALNRSTMTDQAGRPIDFRYLAIIADGGVGKSIVTQWIEYRCNQHDSPVVAFRFDLKSLVQRGGLTLANVRQELFRVLADHWHRKLSDQSRTTVTLERIRAHVRAMLRRPAQVCLIFDGLDQCSKTELDILATILSPDSHEFKNCRFVVAGRPQAYTTNWNTLFDKLPWRLVRVESMTRGQQIRYLGWLPDGSLRFYKIPRGARPILSNPRIMSYLRERDKFTDIRSAADVYAQAVDHLLYQGMTRSEQGSKIGLSPSREPKYDAETGLYRIEDAQVQTALSLLAIVAFMTKAKCQEDTPPTWTDDWQQTGHLPSAPVDPVPKYDYNVVRETNDLVTRIGEHPQTKRLRGVFDMNWDGLAALNSGFLENSFFEDDRGGLSELVWANKSLHEFLLAYYFAQLASPEDTHFLWDWIYIKDQYATEDYYWFWQFLCEMPEKLRKKENWLNSIRFLYVPGIYEQHPDGKRQLRFAKRSTEMIFRSWWRLDEYIQLESEAVSKRRRRSPPELPTPAMDIRDQWRGEFELFRQGDYGDTTQATAAAIVDHLLFLDLSQIQRFKMGTKPEKQGFSGLPDDWQEHFRNEFNSFRDDPTAIVRWFDRFIQDKAMLELRETRERRWAALARRPDREQAFLEYMDDKYPANEAEINYVDLPSEAFPDFGLGRHPVSNRFYRLFDPGHGLRGKVDSKGTDQPSDLWPSYSDYSSAEAEPAIYLSFFDGWVYCQFLYWDGQSCELPHEDQWECAAKFGFGWERWDQPYWWGYDFDPHRDKERINCSETKYGQTLEPSSERANPYTVTLDPQGKGLMDMQGGAWEWCQDPFLQLRDLYQRHGQEIDRDPNVSRSVRGGSFNGDAIHAGCSNRDHFHPVVAYHHNGCRVARAKTRKP
jgi:formylglycine-generating enzyme required for sulfatase activity